MSEDRLERPQIFGGYLLLQALGRGAMGDVFLARPLHAGRGLPSPIVVKRLHGELAEKPGFVARFRHEAAVAVCVDSEHVAKVYDVGAVGETLYIAMEYVPGWPLSRVLDAVLKSGRHASVASVVDLLAGGLEGLAALHGAVDRKTGRPLEVVHRDLSPKNLMVGEDGRMRVIDLGLGKSNAQDWRTRTGVVMGSVGYMPPEQARGQRVDARADVYAMGVVAFEMLALRNYVKRGTVTEMMEASAAPDFVPPSRFRPDVPRELDHVIQRSLMPNRQDRFQSAQEFLDALRAVVPPAFTAGGMTQLLEELFGATRQMRERELQRLLQLPAPEDFETRPTKVYVVREGVVALDQVKTETRPSLGPRGEHTGVTEVSSRSGSIKVQPVSQVSQAPLSQSVAPPQHRSGRATTQHAVVQRGISIPVLVGAVLAAALIGGVVAVFVVLAVLERPAPTPVSGTAVSAPVVQPAPAAPGVTERPAAPPSKAVEAPPPVERRAPRRARRTPTKVAEVPPPKPPAAPTTASLDVALDRLERRVRAARGRAETAEAKAEATKLLLDIAVWKRSKDTERKKDALRTLKARAAGL